MALLRSLLLVPVHDVAAIAAARASAADAILLDLEEGIGREAVDEARQAAVVAAQELRTDHRPVWVRIHPTTTLLARGDIRATLGEYVAGYALPAVQSVNHVRYLDALLRDAEEAADVKAGATGVIALIESAEGLLNARAIASASPRIIALVLDGADFCADLGIDRTRGGEELAYARGHLAVSARSAGVAAVDAAFPFAHDLPALTADIARGRRFGLHGKLVLTADQVGAVNASFRPRAEEVEFARRLQAEHAAATERGEEYAHIDGRIVDAPAAKRADRLIELVTAIEAKEAQAAL